MLADALAVGLPLAAPLVLGLPVAWILRGRAALRAEDWLLAPFLGWAVLALVLQNLVYLDLPVARATPWVWVACAASWLTWARGPGFRASWAALPRKAFVAALLCAGLQGAALLRVGPQHWVGRLWEDQFGYTTMAQFFRDEPYHTQLTDMGQRAYLFRVLRPSMGRFGLPITLKENRVGQSMLQAFLAASLGRDTKPLFGPLIVSGTALLVLAIVLLAGRLGLAPPAALAAAALAGLLPGLTLLQLENFLSHSLVLGVFAVWLVAADELGAQPGVATFATAALVLAFGVADYCEMWAAFVVLGAVVVGARGLEQRRLLRAARSWGLVVLLALALNPGFLPRIFLFTHLATTEDLHAAIYPWAQAPEGLARLWLGDLARAASSPAMGRLADAAGALATLAGVCGLLRIVLWPTRPSRALALGTLALALGALPLRLLGQHPYQFYKTLLTGAPALALGIVALAATSRPRAARVAAWAGVGLAGLATSTATLALVWPTAEARQQPRSNAQVLLDPAVRALATQLESLRGHRLVLGPAMSPTLNAWLTYFARRNEVWLTTPFLGRDRLRDSPAAQPLLDLPRAPADALVLTRRGLPPLPPGARTSWSNSDFELWQPSAGPWLTLFDQEGDPSPVFELDRQPVRLHFLSGQAGSATLGLVRQGPGDDARIVVRVGSGSDALRHDVALPGADGAQATLELDLGAGFTELRCEKVAGQALRLEARAAWH